MRKLGHSEKIHVATPTIYFSVFTGVFTNLGLLNVNTEVKIPELGQWFYLIMYCVSGTVT